MKIFSLLCLLSLLCLTAPSVRAQGAGSREAFVQQVVPAAEPLGREDAVQSIRERLAPQDRRMLDDYLHAGSPGGGHFALIRQEGAAGLAQIAQEGAANLAVMIQGGTGNTTQLTQHGTGNVYGAWLAGSGNRLNVEQRGDDNTYLLEFAGDGLSHRAVQLGTGNQAVQLGTGTVPFGIEQRGDGMTLIIRHDTP